jgi:hypothetical protein
MNSIFELQKFLEFLPIETREGFSLETLLKNKDGADKILTILDMLLGTFSNKLVREKLEKFKLEIITTKTISEILNEVVGEVG